MVICWGRRLFTRDTHTHRGAGWVCVCLSVFAFVCVGYTPPHLLHLHLSSFIFLLSAFFLSFFSAGPDSCAFPLRSRPRTLFILLLLLCTTRQTVRSSFCASILSNDPCHVMSFLILLPFQPEFPRAFLLLYLLLISIPLLPFLSTTSFMNSFIHH